MEVKLKNLGALKQARFTLGDLTIICGTNNTGKTYATYALFGFLFTWKDRFSVEISDDKIKKLLDNGTVSINLQEYLEETNQMIEQACKSYTKQLPKIFATTSDRFKDTEFEVSLDNPNIQLASYERIMRTTNGELFSIKKDKDSPELIVTLLAEKKNLQIPANVIIHVIADTIKDILFTQLLPKPFIASAERTGAAIFRKELNFARNRLLEEMGQADKNIDPMEFLFKDYQDYALPIKINVEFTRQLETIVKKHSFIAEEYPDLLTDFADIIGGEYKVTSNDELYYIPKGKKIRLTMDESSSAVRSLLDIGFYLKHEAQVGDLLMIDEPELNLHPENQRRVARLFARLVNIGIKVFITTHSDYIIKELNTLIMLNHDKLYLKEIAEKEGYRKEEFISTEKIKVYIAEESMIKLTNNRNRTKCHTFTPADINSEMGIEARSFDTTIEDMNRIQSAIVWGDDE
jgi:AAA ATPase domain